MIRKSETTAPKPTHFTIRDAYSGQMLIGGPIPASEYGQLWPMLVGTQVRVGQVLIVEFLQEINGTMQLLYGVSGGCERKHHRVCNKNKYDLLNNHHQDAGTASW